MSKNFFSCKHSYLKPINPANYKQIVDWINDPVFNRFLYQGWKRVSVEDFSKQVKSEQEEESAIIFSQFSKSTNELVGWCGIYLPQSMQHRKANKAEIRSFVGTQFWNQGFGTEQYVMLVELGFENYNFNKMYFGTHQNNKGTQQIYKKLGFTQEGILREDYFRTEYADNYIYSVLKSEYENKIKKHFSKYL